jgi:hypothetical protein
MSDSPYLRLLDRGKAAFERAGIDYPAMRCIVQLKLTLDRRRSLLPNQRETTEGFPWAFYLTYGIFGLFIGLSLFSGSPLFVSVNVAFGMMLFLLAMTMVSDFSSVLLDLTDRGIILPRPVSRRTVQAARLAHIAFYLFRMVGILALAPAVVGAIRFGPAFLAIFALELPLMTAFVILAVSILYMAILRFFDGEKLRDVINYFQIALSFIMVFAYQFLGRFMSLVGQDKDYAIAPWHYFLPSSWFAAPLAILAGGDRGEALTDLAILALAAPLGAALLYRFAVAPYFERNLEKLAAVGGKKRVSSKPAGGHFAALLCRDGEERPFFRLFTLLMANDRSLKLRVYPSLGMAIAMPFVMLLAFGPHGSKAFFPDLSSGHWYLFIYFVLAFISPLAVQMRYSESHKAAWLYFAAPIASPAPIFKAEAKAIIARYVLVSAILSSAIFTALSGLRILPDVGLFLVNSILSTLACMALMPPGLPFSQDLRGAKSEVSVGKSFLMMGIAGGLALVHWGACYVPTGRAINAALSIAAIAVIWRREFSRLSWGDLGR